MKSSPLLEQEESPQATEGPLSQLSTDMDPANGVGKILLQICTFENEQSAHRMSQ